MNPVVRAVNFMGKSFLIIVALLSAAWWMTVICLYIIYGLPEALAFAAGSVTFFVLVYGMRRHSSHHAYDPESSDRR